MLLSISGSAFAHASGICIKARTPSMVFDFRVGAATIFAYFVDYKRPPSHPPFHFGVLQLSHYLILWVGGYFNASRVALWSRGNCFMLVDSSLTNAIMMISRGANWRHFLPVVPDQITYAFSSGLITASGRVGFGVRQALSNRYTTFSLFVYLGLVGTTFALYCYDQDRAVVRRRRRIIGIANAVISHWPCRAWPFLPRRSAIGGSDGATECPITMCTGVDGCFSDES